MFLLPFSLLLSSTQKFPSDIVRKEKKIKSEKQCSLLFLLLTSFSVIFITKDIMRVWESYRRVNLERTMWKKAKKKKKKDNTQGNCTCSLRFWEGIIKKKKKKVGSITKSHWRKLLSSEIIKWRDKIANTYTYLFFLHNFIFITMKKYWNLGNLKEYACHSFCKSEV